VAREGKHDRVGLAAAPEHFGDRSLDVGARRRQFRVPPARVVGEEHDLVARGPQDVAELGDVLDGELELGLAKLLVLVVLDAGDDGVALAGVLRLGHRGREGEKSENR
jgi:hypothetical protein